MMGVPKMSLALLDGWMSVYKVEKMRRGVVKNKRNALFSC